jgi:hypothetical protein
MHKKYLNLFEKLSQKNKNKVNEMIHSGSEINDIYTIIQWAYSLEQKGR